jgi:hypothetical protein
MASWIPMLTVIHVLSAITFIAAHTVSMVVGFRIKALTDPESLRRQLRMSALALSVAYWALLVVLVSGFADGIAGSWFTSGRLWIWASLVILFVVALLMYPFATRPLARVRWALGAPILPRARREVPKEPPVPSDLARMLAAWNPWRPAALGGIGLVLILWMMVTKPF